MALELLVIYIGNWVPTSHHTHNSIPGGWICPPGIYKSKTIKPLKDNVRISFMTST